MNIGELLPVAMSLLVLGIAVAYALNVNADVGDDFDANTIEKNATIDTAAAIAKFPAKLGLIVTIVIAVVIIGLITRYLARI